jgi:hypothetical protein
MTDEKKVIGIRPDIDLDREEPPASVVELWQAALADCLSDGGTDGGIMIWRDKSGVVSCNAVNWDPLQCIGGLSISLMVFENEAGAPRYVLDSE